MNDKPFFMDTNIFIYAYSTQDTVKRDIATKLVSSGQVMSSVQTLNELCNVLRKKFPATYAYAEDILSEIQALLPVVPLNHETTEIALKVSKRYQFNFYDSLILASAIQHNCLSVLTEDLQDGFSLEGGLTIINPFLLK